MFSRKVTIYKVNVRGTDDFVPPPAIFASKSEANAFAAGLGIEKIQEIELDGATGVADLIKRLVTAHRKIDNDLETEAGKAMAMALSQIERLCAVLMSGIEAAHGLVRNGQSAGLIGAGNSLHDWSLAASNDLHRIAGESK